jgi:hypothetical protein
MAFFPVTYCPTPKIISSMDTPNPAGQNNRNPKLPPEKGLTLRPEVPQMRDFFSPQTAVPEAREVAYIWDGDNLSQRDVIQHLEPTIRQTPP